jgi:hypothetical protein
MRFKWLSLFISISLLSLYDAASTVVHSNAYDNLLRTYNSERTVPGYHEKVYEILGGAQGFSDKPTTLVQLSNIVYITVHAALNSKEPDNLFLQKTLKENQSLINMPSLSEARKQDRIYHYGILMVIYAATKLSQQDANIFTLPERVQNYLKNLAEDSILTGVLAQPLKDILSRVNKDGIAQILVSYKFTNAYHSASLNVGGLLLDGAVAVDYTHSGVINRESSSTVGLSGTTTSDVPADIAHLNVENRAKLKRMQLLTKTDANEQARARQIDALTRSQGPSTSGAVGAGGMGGLGALLVGKASNLNRTGGPTVANVNAAPPEIDLNSMFNLSAIKKIGKDLSIESADSKDEKIAKLQAYKEELAIISRGTDETAIKQATDYIKIIDFLIKELKKRKINQQIIDLLTKRGSRVESFVPQEDEFSVQQVIEALKIQIGTLELELSPLEIAKETATNSAALEKIQRQINSKENSIKNKNEAIEKKKKELLVIKEKELKRIKSETIISTTFTPIAPNLTDVTITPIITTVSPPPSVVTRALSTNTIDDDFSGQTTAVTATPLTTTVTSPFRPPSVVKPEIVPEPVIAAKPFKLRSGGTGSLGGDLRLMGASSLNKVDMPSKAAGSKKTRNLEELELDKIKATEKIEAIAHQKEVLELEIQGLEVKRDAELVDVEKEKIEKLIITKNKLLNSKKTLIQSKEEELRKIEEEIPMARILAKGKAWGTANNDDDSGSDSDDDEEDWN